jgi:hypothetical protein
MQEPPDNLHEQQPGRGRRVYRGDTSTALHVASSACWLCRCTEVNAYWRDVCVDCQTPKAEGDATQAVVDGLLADIRNLPEHTRRERLAALPSHRDSVFRV